MTFARGVSVEGTYVVPVPPIYLAWLVALGLSIQAIVRARNGRPLGDAKGVFALAAIVAYLDGGLRGVLLAALAAAIAGAPHLLANTRRDIVFFAASLGGLLAFPGAWLVLAGAIAGWLAAGGKRAPTLYAIAIPAILGVLYEMTRFL